MSAEQPWAVDSYYRDTVIDHLGMRVAQACGHNPLERAARARLIAAAPSILVELRSLRTLFKEQLDSFVESVTHPVSGLIPDADDQVIAEAHQHRLGQIDAVIKMAMGDDWAAAIESVNGLLLGASPPAQPPQQEPTGPLPSIVGAVEFRRKAYCLDCRQWSAVLGMGASHYSEFVNGKRELPKSAMAIAYEYGVPADALFQARPDKGAGDIDMRLAELERQRGIKGDA